MRTPAIELKNISKSFGSVLANKNVNLDVQKGEVLSILGENGSGKTTLIKMLNGLLAPTQGSILINGVEPGPETKTMISYLPERTYFDNGRTIIELVDFFADWCMPCKMFAPILEDAQEELGNRVKIVKINICQHSTIDKIKIVRYSKHLNIIYLIFLL